jgi:cobalamin biosynthesis Mg chelatase CobN
MYRLLSSIAVLLLLVLGPPASAQQETGQAQGDTTTLEYQAQPADTAGMTQRQGTEGQPPAGQPTTGEEVTETGGEMPTTASPLPLLIVTGSLMLAVGMSLGYLSRKRTDR